MVVGAKCVVYADDLTVIGARDIHVYVDCSIEVWAPAEVTVTAERAGRCALIGLVLDEVAPGAQSIRGAIHDFAGHPQAQAGQAIRVRYDPGFSVFGLGRPAPAPAPQVPAPAPVGPARAIELGPPDQAPQAARTAPTASTGRA